MRTLIRMFTLGLALSVAGTTVQAASPAYKQAKSEWKEAKKELKTLDKLIKKVNKAYDKDKDASKINAEIQALVIAEISQVDAMGAKAPVKPKPVHPGDPPPPPPEKSKNPFLDELRAALVDVRKKKKRGLRRAALTELRAKYQKRLKIKETRKDKAK